MSPPTGSLTTMFLLGQISQIRKLFQRLYCNLKFHYLMHFGSEISFLQLQFFGCKRFLLGRVKGHFTHSNSVRGFFRTKDVYEGFLLKTE